jgi:hypothetical protein
MGRERVLPRVEILEKVARYEAHLSRQLYKAVHELEALQARREGGSVPLARLDVRLASSRASPTTLSRRMLLRLP